MPNAIFRDEYRNHVRAALSRAMDMSKLDHRGMEGRAREIFVKDLLQPVMPPYVEIGSGKIADSLGTVSRETDVVIYSAATLPPLLFEPGFGIYPAEAAIYAIEVKSTLTAEAVADAIAKARELRKLRYLASAVDPETFKDIGPASLPVISALFAFQTDLAASGKNEITRYREIDSEGNTSPAIPVICVAGRGYWWFKANEPAEKWMEYPASADHEEITDFIAGVANTVPDRAFAKGRPRFGQYILQPRQVNKV